MRQNSNGKVRRTLCHDSVILQKVLNTKKQQATLAKGTVGAMVTSAASLGLNILQDMSEPVFEMKFESLPPASKVGYRQVLLELSTWIYD